MNAILTLSLILFSTYTQAKFSSHSLLKDQTRKDNYVFHHVNRYDHVVNDIQRVLDEHVHIEIIDEARLNAYATYNEQDEKVIKISSALIQHKLMNEKVLKVLICHELGHFFAGWPKQYRGRSTKESWSSAEGQADFYSTSVCLNKIKISQKKKFETALLNLTKIYAEINFWDREISPHHPDETVVSMTNRKHPNPQCRFDTLLAGLRCQNLHKVKNNGKTYITCKDKKYQQPKCWLAPNFFEDILNNFE